MTPAFAGVADPTGTWTLRLEDGCAGDTGSISAATLTVDGGRNSTGVKPMLILTATAKPIIR